MSAISSIHARQIIDSRGNPTVEVEVTLESGARGLAAVPSGASTGEFEAVELRDGGDAWAGKGVTRAVANVNGEIAAALKGARGAEQGALDRTMIELDGTPNKGRLGANAILGVSLAAAKAAAADSGQELYRYLAELYGGGEPTLLPVPMMNVLNGGAHADNSVDFQEFMVVPAGAASFSECLRVGVEVFHALKKSLAEKGLATAVGDEGGFAPTSSPTRRPWRRSSPGCRPPATSPAPTSSSPSTRRPARSSRTAPTASSTRAARSPPEEMAAYWDDICGRYPVVSIEDGMDEEDWDGWKLLTERLGDAHPARRRRPLRHQSRAAAARDRARRRQLDPGQGQPDRHPDRDPRGDPHGPRGRLHGGDLPSLRRDRGHDDRRPRRRHRRRPDQDRARPRARTGSPSTTGCCGSRRNSGIRLSSQACRRSPRRPGSGGMPGPAA